jgi:hypothetical protein
MLASGADADDGKRSDSPAEERIPLVNVSNHSGTEFCRTNGTRVVYTGMQRGS